jgi:hypothetical protein
LKIVTIKQPWAYAIIHLGKDIENRSWAPKYRGPLLIHAGASMRACDFERVCAYAEEDGLPVPQRKDMLLGGIIGRVNLVKVVEKSRSKWFGGPYGWVLENPQPLPFYPLKGRLGLFEVEGLPRQYLRQ